MYKEEFKKFWDIRSVIIWIVITLAFTFIFVKSELDLTPNGHPSTEYFEIGRNIIKKYGNTVTDDVIKKIKENEYKDREEEINKYLDDEYFKSRNIYTYKDLLNIEGDNFFEANDKFQEKINENYTYKDSWPHYEIQVYNDIFENHDLYYKDKNSILFDTEFKDYREQMIRVFDNEDIKYSFLPQVVVESFLSFNICFLQWLIISCLYLLGMYFTYDKRYKVRNIQYSSKIGKDIEYIKIKVGLISSIVVFIIGIILFKNIYSLLDVEVFYNSYLNSFMSIVSHGILKFKDLIKVYIIFDFLFFLIIFLISLSIFYIFENIITILAFQVPLIIILLSVQNIFFKRQYNVILRGAKPYSVLLQILAIILIALIIFLKVIKNSFKKDLN